MSFYWTTLSSAYGVFKQRKIKTGLPTGLSVMRDISHGVNLWWRQWWMWLTYDTQNSLHGDLHGLSILDPKGKNAFHFINLIIQSSLPYLTSQGNSEIWPHKAGRWSLKTGLIDMKCTAKGNQN